MQLRSSAFVALVLGVVLSACGSKQSPAATPADPPPAEAPPSEEAAEPPAPAAERPTLTAEECSAKGGTVVGDIGDGAIHRSDYRCSSGAEPLGSIQPAADGPVAIEGSVCCPG